jgi:hypothetical protein
MLTGRGVMKSRTGLKAMALSFWKARTKSPCVKTPASVPSAFVTMAAPLRARRHGLERPRGQVVSGVIIASCSPLAHDVTHTGEQRTAQRAARDAAVAKVLGLKAACFEQCHRQGVAQHEHGGGAGGGGQVQRAGLLCDMHIEHDVGIFCQRGLQSPRDGDDREGQSASHAAAGPAIQKFHRCN